MKVLTKLMIAAMLCGLISGCGSDDKEGGAATNTVSNNSPTSTNTSSGYTSSSFQDFKNKVVAGQFAPSTGHWESYEFENCSLEQDKVLGFININTTSCSAGFMRIKNGCDIDREDDSNDSIAAAKSYLAGLVNANNGQAGTYFSASGDGSAYQVLSGNYFYEINLRFPAIANPVARYEVAQNPYYGNYYATGDSYKMKTYYTTGSNSCTEK